MAEGGIGWIFESRRDIEVWKTMSQRFLERYVTCFQRGLAFAPERSERVGLILFLLSDCLCQVRIHATAAWFDPGILLEHSRDVEFVVFALSMVIASLGLHH